MVMTKDDLLILDEADYHLLDEIKDLPPKNYGVIAMTATDVGKTGGNEEKRLQQLKMPVYQSKIAANIDLSKPLEKISIADFLNCNRNDRGRLIWCKETDLAAFKSAAIEKNYDPVINQENF